jgi:hypothetical protein
MQINAATLLASQQMSQIQAKPAPGFAAALDKTDGFQPLPLKQTAHTDESVATPQTPAGPARLGAMIDIKV